LKKKEAKNFYSIGFAGTAAVRFAWNLRSKVFLLLFVHKKKTFPSF